MKFTYVLSICLPIICISQLYSMELTEKRKCRSADIVHKPLQRVTQEEKCKSLDSLLNQSNRKTFLPDMLEYPAYCKQKKFNQLHVAVLKNNVNRVQDIIDESLNSQDKEGHSPLWLAVREYASAKSNEQKSRLLVIITLLVQSGASVHLENNEGYSLLNWVISKGLTYVLPILLTSTTVDVNKKDRGEDTPLAVATWSPVKKRKKIMKQLISANADTKGLESGDVNPEALAEVSPTDQEPKYSKSPVNHPFPKSSKLIIRMHKKNRK